MGSLVSLSFDRVIRKYFQSSLHTKDHGLIKFSKLAFNIPVGINHARTSGIDLNKLLIGGVGLES